MSQRMNSRNMINSSSQRAESRSPAHDAASASTTVPSVVCIDENKSVFDALVSKVVKEHIFPKKQFVVLERELDEGSKLADKCIKVLNIERTKWYSIRNKIRKGLNKRRNNVQQSVRRSYIVSSCCLGMHVNSLVVSCALCFTYRIYEG